MQTEVELTRWFLSRVLPSASTRRGPVRVWGYSSDGRLWRSSSVRSTSDPRTLLTRYGTLVRLQGPIDKQACLLASIPAPLVSLFKDGLPSSWLKAVSEHFAIKAQPRRVEASAAVEISAPDPDLSEKEAVDSGGDTMRTRFGRKRKSTMTKRDSQAQRAWVPAKKPRHSKRTGRTLALQPSEVAKPPPKTTAARARTTRNTVKRARFGDEPTVEIRAYKNTPSLRSQPRVAKESQDVTTPDFANTDVASSPDEGIATRTQSQQTGKGATAKTGKPSRKASKLVEKTLESTPSFVGNVSSLVRPQRSMRGANRIGGDPKVNVGSQKGLRQSRISLRSRKPTTARPPTEVPAEVAKANKSDADIVGRGELVIPEPLPLPNVDDVHKNARSKSRRSRRLALQDVTNAPKPVSSSQPMEPANVQITLPDEVSAASFPGTPMMKEDWSQSQVDAFDEQRTLVPGGAHNYWGQVAANVPGKTAAECRTFWSSKWTSPPRTKDRQPTLGDTEENMRSVGLSTPEIAANMATAPAAAKKTAKYKKNMSRVAAAINRQVDDEELEFNLGDLTPGAPGTHSHQATAEVRQGAFDTATKSRIAAVELLAAKETPENLSRGRSFGLPGAYSYLAVMKRRVAGGSKVPFSAVERGASWNKTAASASNSADELSGEVEHHLVDDMYGPESQAMAEADSDSDSEFVV